MYNDSQIEENKFVCQTNGYAEMRNKLLKLSQKFAAKRLLELIYHRAVFAVSSLAVFPSSSSPLSDSIIR